MEFFLTKDKYKELEEELERLKTSGRKDISESLKTAKELGDLSENAEYIEARENQQRLEKRIAEVEHMINNVQLINSHGSGKNKDNVSVGSTVEVTHDGKSHSFFIVGSNEADPTEGYISNESPLGRELVGKKVGDVVVVKTPGGKAEYKVKKIN